MNGAAAKKRWWLVALGGIVILAGLLVFLGGRDADSGLAAGATAEPTPLTRTATPTANVQPATATPADSSPESRTFASIEDLMIFLADDDPYLGPEDAPVVIVEFSDYACPFCGKFYLDTLPLILEAYPDDVKYIHRDYPIFGDVSFKLADSVDCALEQGKFWEMHRAYLEVFSDFDPASIEHDKPQNPDERDERFDYYTDEQILELAESAGVEPDAFSSCLSEARYQDEVAYDYQIGREIGIQGVPFFIINGQVVNGAQSFEVFQQVIEDSLAAAS
jgi:protein-disulfide isomerase